MIVVRCLSGSDSSTLAGQIKRVNMIMKMKIIILGKNDKSKEYPITQVVVSSLGVQGG